MQPLCESSPDSGLVVDANGLHPESMRGDPQPESPRHPLRGRSRWLCVAIAVFAVLPLLVLAGRALFQNWLPVGDVATIGLRVAEVGTSHTPLVGPYSHFGWSHPG